jgi:hypothetical protein
MIETKFYILFPSSTESIRMENILKKQRIKYTIVPTPSELSETCGTSIMYNKKDEGKIKILIEMNGISIGGMNRLSKEKKRLHIVN